MAFVAPNEGERRLLEEISAAFAVSYSVALFANDITPAATHVLADVTPASDISYAICNFGSVTTDGGGKAVMVQTATTFTQTADTTQTVYGYYITNGTYLIVAERFASPITLTTNGDQIRMSSLSFRLYN